MYLHRSFRCNIYLRFDIICFIGVFIVLLLPSKEQKIVHICEYIDKLGQAGKKFPILFGSKLAQNQL